MKRSFFRTLIIILIIITIPFPVFADYGPIQIDSHYDDWEDKPHMEVYPGNNPPENKINHVSLFRDESNAYVHVIFAYSNNQGIKNMTINLKTNMGNKNFSLVSDSFIPDSFEEEIDMDDSESSGGDQNLFASGGVKEDIFLVAENEDNVENTETQDADAGQEIVTEPADQNGSNEPEEGTEPTDLFEPDTTTDEFDTDLEELEPNMNQKKPGEYGTWAFSVMDGDFSVGSGYYTRTEGAPDELELYIPLSSITQQYDGITEISMVIKKLGKQEIFCVGASTAPFLGIAVGAGIVMLSVGAYTYRKRNQC